MSENTNIVRRLIEDVWNKRNINVVDQLVTSDCRNIDPSSPDVGTGPEAYKTIVTLYTTAFPDVHFVIDDIIESGDKVAVRWTFTGTHKGELNGIAPTGKRVTNTGISFCLCSNGKIATSYVNWDALGMMQQLGVIPATGKVGRAA